LIVEPPIGELATGEAHVEVTVVESIMPPEIILEDVTGSKVNSPVAPTVEVSSTDPAVAEDTSLEYPHRGFPSYDNQH